MKYLSEIRNELPLNCMFNKVRVGCGGTTLALESTHPYVICVPYVALIDNKIVQNASKRYWLGVRAGVKEADIRTYLINCDKKKVTPKILCTYDALPKVTATINPQEYYLLVDEYHILFQHYSFRYEAVRGVLDCYKRYKAYTFMTATPLEPLADQSYMLSEFRALPYVQQDWNNDPNVIDVRVDVVKCCSVQSKTIDIIQRHLNGQIEGNAYFFCNSTEYIQEIFEKVNLNDKNTRVIYSKNNHSTFSFQRGATTDAPKKINFLTSTAFEGCDIYDEDGVTYVVSTKNKRHTLLDISSSIQQIIGRIRNSKYKGRIMHICNTDSRWEVSQGEFEAKQAEYEKNCIRGAAELNESLGDKISWLNQKTTAPIFNQELAPYMVIREGVIIYDVNMKYLDAYQYAIRRQYFCKVSLEVAYCNIDADVHIQNWYKSLQDLGITSNTPASFQDAVLECKRAREETIEGEERAISKWEVKYPIIREAIGVLGYERICSLHYVQKDIRDRLLLEDKKLSNGAKIVTKCGFENGAWYSSKTIKKKLQNAYKALNIAEAATASKIEEFYRCELRIKKIDGKTVRGYTIYLPLFRHKKNNK